ncbi:unnamed protein product [Periconia digitata]|uniref:Uncharacterized protein n=1 Tax=Periconia digitata TaxID=1303443 RepID=A0A9W4UR60_9PLEO|nr:unnamed protein product [Periconia digitata]
MLLLSLMSTFAASAAAQITTSMWAQLRWDTDKIGYVGSVIDVQGGRTTIDIKPDDGVHQVALGIPTTAKEIVTIAPTYYGGVYNNREWNGKFHTAGEIKFACERNVTDSVEATCTESYGAAMGILLQCQDLPTRSTKFINTVTHDYPSRGTYSSGLETVTRTPTIVPKPGPLPSWCASGTAAASLAGTSAESSTVISYKKENFGFYQLTITAGLEKLEATPTPDASSSTPASQNRGASVPAKTAGPIVAGMAVAAALMV